MFVVKPRITLFVCVLIALVNYVVVQFDGVEDLKQMLCWVMLVLAVLPGLCRKDWAIGVVCPCVIAACWVYFDSCVQHERRYSLLNLADRETSLLGTVCDTAISPSGKRKHVVVEVRSFVRPMGMQNRGRLLLWTSPDVSLKCGDYVVLRGEVQPALVPKYKWDFNEASLLNRFGAVAKYRLDSAMAVIPIKQRTDFLVSLRSQIIATHIQALGKRYGNLLTSMVIGNRNVELDEGVTNSFRNLGLSHMLAASGFNLSIVVATTWSLLRPVVRNRIALNLCAGAMMIFYSLLAGVSASIERAALMCGAVLVAKSAIRAAYLPAVLALSLAVTLCVDPFALADVGLQLSYAATAVLICTGQRIATCRNLSRNRIVRYIVEISLSCVAAVASVLPLQLYYFWQTGLLQLPANAVISPLIPIVTVEGFVTSTLACLRMPGLAVFADQAIGYLIRALMGIVECLDSLKWSVISTGPPSVPAMLFYYFSLCFFLLCARLNWRAAVAGACLLLATVALLYRPALPPLTVVYMREGVIAIDSERNAVVVGDMLTLQMRRCLAYFGTRAVRASEQPTGGTACMQWQTRQQDIVVIVRTTGREVHFPLYPRYRLRNSMVRVYR